MKTNYIIKTTRPWHGLGMEPFWRCMFVRQHAAMLVTSIISICKTVNKVDLLDRFVYINIYLIFKYCFICFNMEKRKYAFLCELSLLFCAIFKFMCVLCFSISEGWNNNVLNITYKDKVYHHYKIGRWSQFWFIEPVANVALMGHRF